MTRRQLMHLQRAGGIFFIITTIIILKVASTGTDVISQDATAIFFTAPLGLWWTFTKKLVIPY